VVGIKEGGSVQPKITDVERLKKQVRKLVAGQVLSGGSANVCLELGEMPGCGARIAAGYGTLSQAPEATAQDRLIWILDGRVSIETAGGQIVDVSQGESTVLTGGVAYRLVCPQLTIYLLVEAEEKR
jgi:hypothetical protein